ncbi:MAG TPA: GNAT family N-acetyltransferase [Acidimicrobiales bacterium]|nr:GNAT family N-acetyltransferase [Acidimicrobiales bacterium]
MPILIEEATAVTPELVAAFRLLTPQLSRSAPAPGGHELAEMVRSPATILLMARDADKGLIGSLTLVLFRIPTGVRAWIEDVVVDKDSRGRGVAEILCREALNRASSAGARTVDLTSRPSREAANRLYRRLGFVERETNVYRWSG